MSEEVIKTTLQTKDEFVSDLVLIMEDGIQKKELRQLNAHHLADTYYYVLTCIDLSAGLMNKEQALSDMRNCFEILWEGIKGM
jgi:hypothetical protein